ncbi:hypothetical protein QFC21_002204 [Naganishia friedmannii]|uniref:Uncharacterized protein n=1 Tax=Naganishia friedmannii TaxID=89922 RepID=A0ACC2VXE7_9TREE|nr:hypothetical protein QFC21_002204 [Naganishia friedmannii]
MRTTDFLIPLLVLSHSASAQSPTTTTTTTSTALGSASAAARAPEIQSLAETISDDQLQKVRDVMERLCVYSWENGTKAQALIEYAYQDFSPFSPTFGNALTDLSLSQSIPDELIAIARTTLEERPSSSNQSGAALGGVGIGSLLQDGSSADPASLGVAVLLANASAAVGTQQVKNVGWGAAAESELRYLLERVPRNSAGAISHRSEQAQLWSDFVYMVPPFLAYYGYLHSNQTLLQEAYTQCSLYRSGLQDPSTKLWRHIAQGTGTSDPGLWATGNAWAAAGMLRVLATIIKSPYSDAMASQRADLQTWSDEIITAAKSRTAKDGLVRNYIDNTSTFEDTAGSTLLAAAAYRLATMNLTTAHVDFANQIHSTVAARHINSTGYLTGAVDPLNFGKQGTYSPEGQAFVLLMQVAYKEYIASGGNDKTSAAMRLMSAGWMGGIGVSFLLAIGLSFAIHARQDLKKVRISEIQVGRHGLRATAVIQGTVAVPALKARSVPEAPLAPSTILQDDTLAKVKSVMEQLCTHSWENGTKAQALIEYSYPDYSPFSATFQYPIKGTVPDEIIAIARTTMQNRPASQSDNGSGLGPGPLLEDESAGDPASLGIAVLLASSSSNANVSTERVKDVGYSEAAKSQMDFLTEVVPGYKTTGAISHRVHYSQAWADSVSMVPPFFAYYGLLKGTQEPLSQAYSQCSLYRKILQNNTTKLWRHMEINTIENDITDASGNTVDQTAKPDISLWATGNAWAASGMLRVYATILKSSYNEVMSKECDDLKLWVEEIIAGTTAWNASNGLVHNHIIESSTFEDTAGSTLLAATMYRLAALNITTAYVPYANKIYSTIAKDHINDEGYLTGAVDPLYFDLSTDKQGTHSPEGQAFVLMMHAAYRDYSLSVPKETQTEDSGFYSEASRFQGPPAIDRTGGS